MSKIIRLENSGFGPTSFDEDDVDRVLEFDSAKGTLKVYALKTVHKVPFSDRRSMLLLAESVVGKGVRDGGGTKIIHNLPVKDAYSAPFKVYLDVNLACSLRCSFCLSNAGRREKSFLPLSVIERLAGEMKALGVMYVKIGGGDPLLHPYFPEILAVLRRAGCFITMSTNSVTMTRERAALLAANDVRVSVSIEGMESVNDSFRGRGHFRKAMGALSILKRSGADVLLRTTLLRENLKEISNLVGLARESGTKIKFSYCRSAGRAVHNEALLGPQDSSAYVHALQYLNGSTVLPYVLMDEGMMFEQPKEAAERLFRGRMCGAANRSMHIDAHGKVSPCVFFGPAFSFGKIYQDGTLVEFWRGAVGNRFSVVRGIRQPSECDGCSRLCKNECPANRLYFWGNFEKQDPNCLGYALERARIGKVSF